MVDFLRTAVSGLMAFKHSLTTTGHNIANANTPSYNRQRVDLVATPAERLDSKFLGTGVSVAGVSRVYNDFLTQQVRGHSSSFNQLDTLNGLINQLSSLVGDAAAGLSPSLQRFFASVQEVANAPSSIPARQTMLSEGQALAAHFHDMDFQLGQLRENVNRGLRDAVDEINTLADSIAKVNQDITLARGGLGATPNDLLDQRDALLAELSQRVTIQTVAQGDGSLSVFIGSGQALVLGKDVNRLEVGRAAFDPQDIEIRFQGQPAGMDMSNQLNGGKVGGYMAFRREVLDPAKSALGLLAVGLTETFNAQHHKGMDLAGNLGKDFFQAGPPQVLAHVNNTIPAAATVSATIADAAQLQRSDYELSYTATGYSLRRLSDNTVTALGGPFPVSVDGLEINVSGPAAVGDRFLIQPTRAGATNLAVTLSNTSEIAAAAPIRSETGLSNLGSGTVSAGEVLDASNPDLRNTVRIEFTAPGVFDVIDLNNPANNLIGQTYTSGADIDVNGWRVRISGTPQVGDIFQVGDNTNGGGDNRNALALSALQSQKTLLNDANGMATSDYQGLYAQLVADVGTRGSRTQNTLKSQQALLDQATQSRDAVSGVNLDEEAANMMRFQQAYEASAQMIRVADSLFETLMGVARR